MHANECALGPGFFSGCSLQSGVCSTASLCDRHMKGLLALGALLSVEDGVAQSEEPRCVAKS
jgi:hypothetical protein